ncbi:G-type lectin S-receptor-like serine/threonine-protein kinase B120 [Dioscorea cayenensis subsp. rotundata]|uniref:G-type lectin S-receptor-like serine/threonine-protein kinase B120 n=1 Tax=Dioscorea cayennensis subsp. rotundata TaxID=55577 RepID=A0AB40CLG2_DIOCR|nr:G-type lectin S-receptor-like serine/threonine-protein kinase B120 [Dioscorea cayenensis subsp. rotundata]
MMLGGQNQLITSWRNSEDPAPGVFSLGLDPNNTHQLLFQKTGQASNSQNFSRVLKVASYFYNFSYVPLWNLDNYSYAIDDRTTISRGIMDVSGQFKQLTWFQDRREWVAYWAEPEKFPCEVPSYCGFNGLCANDSNLPCKCLLGFQPSSQNQWRSNDWSGGCVRRATLQCGKGDGFLKLTSTKLPIFQTDVQNLSLALDDCKAMCLKNCSCTAYASANGNGTGCLLWSKDLLGLQENYDGGQDIYVRLVASELNQVPDHGKKSSALVIILVVTGTIAVLLPGAVCCKYGKTIGKKLRNQDMSRALLLFKVRKKLRNQEMSSNPKSSKLFADAMMHGEDNKGCPQVSFTAIAAATNNFCDSNKLGEGGFGPVYMGMLEGYTVAIKRLAKNSGQGNREFKNEITLIANLQHKNLVRLLGCCIEKEEKILIYEYLPNKSLDTYIFDASRRAELDWQKRFHTIEGIAQGLLYLHKFSRLKVIHRDLKTSNILLDSEMNPKISDFGLARIFGQNENQANTRRVVGTYGYMAPEYAMEGLFSVKSDIYSFGVMLLEIVSGKKNTCFQHANNTVNLLGYAWELWTEGRSLELVDPILGDLYPPQEVSRCIHVALLCVQDHAADRPNISAVISMLHNETCLPFPKQPAFYIARDEGPSSDKGDIYTLNNVSFTSMQGR